MGRRKRGWNVAAGLSLNDLRRLLQEKVAASSELASRRKELAAQLAEVDEIIAAASGEPRRGRTPRKGGPARPPMMRRGHRRGPGRPPRVKRGRPAKAKVARATGTRRKSGPKGQSELHGLIRNVLTGASEPMKAADIAKKVVSSGYKTKSKVFHLIVGQRLAEMKDVKKPERGMYVITS